MANAPVTAEGARLWPLLRGPGVWIGGGMTPARLDRAAIVDRLNPDVPRWVVDELLDGYEAGLADSRAAQARAGKGRPPPSSTVQ